LNNLKLVLLYAKRGLRNIAQPPLFLYISIRFLTISLALGRERPAKSPLALRIGKE